jgi:hypothetical protein
MLPNLSQLLERLDQIEASLFDTHKRVMEMETKLDSIHEVFQGLASILPNAGGAAAPSLFKPFLNHGKK